LKRRGKLDRFASGGDIGVRSLLVARAVVVAALTALVSIGVLSVAYMFWRSERTAPPSEKDVLLTRLFVAERVPADDGDARLVLPLSLAAAHGSSGTGADALLHRSAVFRHAPFESAGLNHLTLPFHFENENGQVNQREGLAFSFLLSNALDWTPGCYCARHAYFIFKRSRTEMISAARRYDRDLIQPLIERWRATHAIGGRIRRGREGYSGELKIFGRDGQQVFEASYQEPRDYFDLLGDMCVDAMRFLGHEPSPELVAHLHAKRCVHYESVVDFGRAAFAEERSPEEFRRYRLILERDPGFAEVRCWAANQAYWKHKDRAAYELQKGIALQGYLVEAALGDFRPECCPDQKLAAEYPAWLDRAELLVGADSPSIAALRLKQACRTGRLTSDVLNHGLELAAKYPNSHELLHALVDTLTDERYGPADSDLAAEISIAALNSKYVPGSAAATDHMRAHLAQALMELGHNHAAEQQLRPIVEAAFRHEDKGPAALYCGKLAQSLRNMGRYRESLRFRELAVEAWQEPCRFREEQVVQAGICAALSGKPETVKQILADHGAETGVETSGCLLESYLKLLNGEPLDAEATARVLRFQFTRDWRNREVVILLAQSDLLAGRFEHRERLAGFLETHPNDRELWILLDAYERKRPTPGSHLFYESLAWLHGDDDWVKRAVADSRGRPRQGQQGAPTEIRELLAEYEPLRWPTLDGKGEPNGSPPAGRIVPGAVAVAVRQLLTEGNNAEAKQLSLRYAHYAALTRHPAARASQGHALRAYCKHLCHLAAGSAAIEAEHTAGAMAAAENTTGNTGHRIR